MATAKDRMKKYRERLKENPEKYEDYKEKEKERYRKRVEEGKIKRTRSNNAKKEISQKLAVNPSEENNALEKRKMSESTSWTSASELLVDDTILVESNSEVSRKSGTKQNEIKIVKKKAGEKNKKIVKRQKGKKKILKENSGNEKSSNEGKENKKDLRKLAGKRRRRKYISKLNSKIADLKLELALAKKKIRALQKQVSRLKEKKLSTPEKNVKNLLKGQKVSVNVKKKLLFSEVMEAQIKDSFKEKEKGSKKVKREFAKKIGGTVLRRYKYLTYVKKFGHRRAYEYEEGKYINTEKQNQAKEKRLLVKTFFEKDENSRLAPGKKDTIIKGKIKYRKRYLNDTIKNLYEKFQKENPGIKIKLPVFCRLRPFYVVRLDRNKRDTCQYITDANFELLVKKLKILKIIVEPSPQDIIKAITCKERDEKCFRRTCKNCKEKKIIYAEYDSNEDTFYHQWLTRKYTINVKGKEKNCKKMVKEEIACKKKDLVNMFEKSLKIFFQHYYNMIHQYKAISFVKKNLSPDDLLIHADFSENYQTKYAEEVQSTHFGGKTQISLHTVVAYYSEENTLKNINFCTASPNTRHDAAAICCHLLPVAEKLKQKVPNPKTVHFLTDSPSNQYRNRKMFELMAKFLMEMFNVKKALHWHFSEQGHGKGAPDGIGGLIKSTADRIVGSGKDMSNFETFLKELRKEVKSVEILEIDEGKITEIESFITEELISFVGTMKVHEVVYKKDSDDLEMRRLTCTSCKSDDCSHYKLGKFSLLPPEKKQLNEHESNVKLQVKPSKKIRKMKRNANESDFSSEVSPSKKIKSKTKKQETSNLRRSQRKSNVPAKYL